MKGPKGRLVTSSNLARYLQSPFTLWCDFHAPPGERDPRDSYREYLQEAGMRHELDTVEALYPKAKSLRDESPEESFRLALESMADGAETLHNPTLFWKPETLRTEVDLLERADGGPSHFGRYHYVVKEIKMAKSIDDHHILQAAYNNYLLGRVQGFTPSQFFLINRDREELAVAYDEQAVKAALKGVRSVLRATSWDPVFGHSLWPWETYGDKAAVAARDVSLVSGVGPSMREKLRAAGFTSFDDLATAYEPDLRKVKGIGAAYAKAFKANAIALVAGKPLRIGSVKLPRAESELYVDLEGTANQLRDGEVLDMDYLIGVLVRERGKERFHSFVAEGPKGERKMFRDFVEFVASFNDPVLFHWSPAERTRFRRMAKLYKLGASKEDRLLDKMHDLKITATAAFAFPTYGYGLKKVAPYLGYKWSQDDVSATASIALYFQYLEDPKKNAVNLEKIIRYNREDCEAMRVVRDWLAAQR